MKVLFAVPLRPDAGGGGGGAMGVLFKELEDIKAEIVFMEPGKPLSEQVEDVEVIIPAVSQISAEVINAAPKLKLICQAGIGVDSVDVPTATKRNIPVANVPYGSAIAMGEYTFVLMLALSRKLIEAQENMNKGAFFIPNGMELAEKTLGLMGLGYSGKEVAKRARAFDMKIIAIDKIYDRIKDVDVDFLGGIDKLDYILENSDFVSLHCPANEETMGMINYEKICKMKQTAYLINLARASIIDRDGFIKAMKEHKIAGAALDVFWSEPMELNDEIYSLDNVYMTPHIATSTIETRTRNILEVTRSIKKVALGEKPDYCVNM